MFVVIMFHRAYVFLYKDMFLYTLVSLLSSFNVSYLMQMLRRTNSADFFCFVLNWAQCFNLDFFICYTGHITF